MPDASDMDFGPLAGLVGEWKGAEGTDIAPEPDGKEVNPYFETITYSPVGGVRNAESQSLSAIHYRQIVQRKSSGAVFHHQTGYWIWEAESDTVMHSLTIPRGVCVLAGGEYSGETDADGRAVIEVSANVDDERWKIIEAPFMRDNASTRSYWQQIIIGRSTLSYRQTIMVDIYGKLFEHTDQNILQRA
jgi:hypothetical protein